MIGYIIAGLGLYALTQKSGSSLPAAETDKYDAILKNAGYLYGIPWQFLKAYLAVESNYGTADFIKNKTPNNGRYGIMGTSSFDFINAVQEIGNGYTLKDVWNPEVSIEVCAFQNRKNEQKAEKSGFMISAKTILDSGSPSAETEVRLGRIVGAYFVGFDNLSSKTQEWQKYFSDWMTAYKQIRASEKK